MSLVELVDGTSSLQLFSFIFLQCAILKRRVIVRYSECVQGLSSSIDLRFADKYFDRW